jgi:hypothetical protein
MFHESVRDKKNQYLLIDSTLVRAHQQAATGPKKGRGQGSGAGLTTEIHLLVNELGLPLDFILTGGQISDYTPAIELLGRRQAEAVIADKGYDSDQIVTHINEKMKTEAVIPPRSNRKQQRE